MATFLEESGGRGGVQHVAFDFGADAAGEGLVGEAAREEMRRRKQMMKDRGYGEVMSGVWRGKRGMCEFCFFGTEGAVGTCLETIVWSRDWVEPVDVVSFPEGMGRRAWGSSGF